jgi:hypothetical protein
VAAWQSVRNRQQLAEKPDRKPDRVTEEGLCHFSISIVKHERPSANRAALNAWPYAD